MKRNKNTLIWAFSLLVLSLSGCQTAKNLTQYYDAAITVKYCENEVFKYQIVDYQNEVATIDFSRCEFYDSAMKCIDEYHFKDQETFKMYYETVFASEPRDFWALYAFVNDLA